ncbi:MAG: hypothetical protein JWO05_1107 [Gemmatimonadetes bacterium]|nr:hypothetical protein [Gemmatimonadota bacterium]
MVPPSKRDEREAPDVGITSEFEAQPRELEAVRARLSEIQKGKRGRVRWQITKHTAELAIRGIEHGAGRKGKAKGKSRRGKGRKKRLL